LKGAPSGASGASEGSANGALFPEFALRTQRVRVRYRTWKPCMSERRHHRVRVRAVRARSRDLLTTPPRRLIPVTTRHIHNAIAHGNEGLLRKRLSEEVGEMIHSGHERDTDAVILDELAHEEVSPVDMFHSAIMLGIVGYVDAGLVVHVQVDGPTVV
jgi:hypothetical protein